MRSYLRAQVQIRRRWLLATVIVPALLIADASQLTTSANAMMRGPMHHHRGGGGGGFGAGVGVGIGVGIGAMMINQIQRQQAQNAQQAPANQKAQKPAAKKDGGKAATPKNKKKDDAGLTNMKDDPNPSGKNQDNPALTTKKDEPGPAGKSTSATPALTSKQVVTPVPVPAPPPANCNDCLPLWEAIVRYHKVIEADIEKLRRARLELEDNKASRAKLVVQLRTAAPADKQSFQTLIDYTDQTIAHRTMFNDELEKIIEEEKARLAELIAEYQRCVDKLCAKKVAEPAVAPQPRVVETPIAPPPIIPAPPPPEQPPLAPPTKVSTTPQQPAPASTPTNANRAICGPDVTDLVVNALRRLKKQFDGANDEVRKAACETITSVNTGPKSWDISALSPNTAPFPNTQYSPAVDGWTDNSGKIRKQPWFTGISQACAIPRPTCGATVEFMGTCQHAQVVNYTQWGMMTELCGGHYKLIGGALHAAWNLVAYRGGAPGVAQDNMVAVGKELKEELDKDPTNGTAPDLSEIKSRLQERVQAMGDYEFKQCELACKLTPKEQKDLQSRGFHADWVGLNSFQRF